MLNFQNAPSWPYSFVTFFCYVVFSLAILPFGVEIAKEKNKKSLRIKIVKIIIAYQKNKSSNKKA
jgi:hypothetical protein